MENKILIHKDTNYNKIIFKYLIALFPLIIYGLYKNGIVLYINKEITLIEIFKPLSLPMLGFLVGLIVNFLKTKKISLNLTILNGLLIGMSLPLNTNLIVFLIVTFGLLYVCSFIEKKVKFNIACLIKLAVVLILFLFGKYEYANSLELSSSFAYSFIDLIFGRQIGGVSASSCIWIVVGFIYLMTDYYYKKDIPIISYLSYALVCCLSLFFTKDLSLTLNMLIAATPLFCFVFIAPISEYSPYANYSKIVYSVLIGVISALLGFIVTFEASFIACLVLSLLKDIIDSLIGQKMAK